MYPVYPSLKNPGHEILTQFDPLEIVNIVTRVTQPDAQINSDLTIISNQTHTIILSIQYFINARIYHLRM
jgi:hypothetical protein